MAAKTYTIEQIKRYIQSQDSLGDIVYYLSEDNIDKANLPEEPDEDDLEFIVPEDEDGPWNLRN